MRLPDGSQTEAQHCFHVNPDGLEVQGINGIMQAYKDGMSRLFFSGPTLFAPIINASTAIAAGANCRYHSSIHEGSSIVMSVCVA